jgi:hypothetical protein
MIVKNILASKRGEDDRKIPPYAGGGAGKADRHRVNW